VLGNLTEGHLQSIPTIVVTSQPFPWRTTQQAWGGLDPKAVYDKGKTGENLFVLFGRM